MNTKYKTPNKSSFGYFAICIVSCIYSIISISSYIKNGYIVIRSGETTGIIAIAVIICAVITSIVSGCMFKITKKDEAQQRKNA